MCVGYKGRARGRVVVCMVHKHVCVQGGMHYRQGFQQLQAFIAAAAAVAGLRGGVVGGRLGWFGVVRWLGLVWFGVLLAT